MPKPDVIIGEKSRIGMLHGFESMGHLLSITLGPIGGYIASAKEPDGRPELLNDAATIARRIIEMPGRADNAGAMLMRHIVWHVREELGDGSATAAVLAQSIAQEMHHMISAGANAMMVKRGIDKAADVVLKKLDELSTPLEGEARIAAVATAAVGDAEIGKLLGEIYDVLGPNASVVIEPYIATYHDRTYHEGARFRGGILSPYLYTDTVRRQAVLDDVHVLVADMPFDSTASVANVLGQVVTAGGKNVLILCKAMSDAGIGVLVSNNEAEVIQSCVASMKPIGDLRKGMIENIAILTGGRPLTDKSGMEPERITIEDIGHAERVIVTRDWYMIIGGSGDRAAARQRVKELRGRLAQSHDADERKTLRELITHFSAGVAELRVGALTAKERETLTETAEQAMRAVQAGMEAGILPGGGAAYLACIPAVQALELEDDEAIGAQIVARALEAPMRTIAFNASHHPPLIIAEVQRQGVGFGFDVINERVVDMVEAGIVDPANVTKRAFERAVSGAMMLLTTDALVLTKKPQESFEP